VLVTAALSSLILVGNRFNAAPTTHSTPATHQVIKNNAGVSSFRGARVTKSATQSVNNSSDTAVTFNTESYDTDGIHDNVTNNTRLTVPAGVSYVDIGYNLAWASGAADTLRASWITKNGVNIGIGDYRSSKYEQRATVKTGPIAVTPGDYFQLLVFQESGGALNVSTETVFWMEIIE
jgi:hypothetical protein